MRNHRRITVELDEADALTVGLSLRSVAQRGGIPADAIGRYDRVGRALIKAVQEPAQPATTEVVS